MLNRLRYVGPDGTENKLKCYTTWLPADIAPTRICDVVRVTVTLEPSETDIERWENDGGASV